MPIILDTLYALALAILAPSLIRRAIKTGRYRRELATKLRGNVEIPQLKKPIVWFHGVSVGEVHLLATIIAAYRLRHPARSIVVSCTTDAGLAEARSRFADLTVIPYPFDFSWAVANALDRVHPSFVLGVFGWGCPNFLAEADRRRIPVVVINARMSPKSLRRLRRFAGIARSLLYRHIAAFGVQSAEYAEALREFGAGVARRGGCPLVVTGSVKYDGASGDPDSAKTLELRRLLVIPKLGDTLVWVAGSTCDPEESILLNAFASLKLRFPSLLLILVPRHPERFDEVAKMLEVLGVKFVRRSRIESPLAEPPPVILLDTMGELSAAWGLADVGFTGGSLDGIRGGQSMIQPAGLGIPNLFGPHIWNFRDAARGLIDAGAAKMIADGGELERETAELLLDPQRRAVMGEAARKFVQAQQGATRRTIDLLDEVFPDKSS